MFLNWFVTVKSEEKAYQGNKYVLKCKEEKNKREWMSAEKMLFAISYLTIKSC
jgi:hypothetical protein